MREDAELARTQAPPAGQTVAWAQGVVTAAPAGSPRTCSVRISAAATPTAGVKLYAHLATADFGIGTVVELLIVNGSPRVIGKLG